MANQFADDIGLIVTSEVEDVQGDEGQSTPGSSDLHVTHGASDCDNGLCQVEVTVRGLRQSPTSACPLEIDLGCPKPLGALSIKRRNNSYSEAVQNADVIPLSDPSRAADVTSHPQAEGASSDATSTSDVTKEEPTQRPSRGSTGLWVRREKKESLEHEGHKTSPDSCCVCFKTCCLMCCCCWYTLVKAIFS